MMIDIILICAFAAIVILWAVMAHRKVTAAQQRLNVCSLNLRVTQADLKLSRDRHLSQIREADKLEGELKTAKEVIEDLGSGHRTLGDSVERLTSRLATVIQEASDKQARNVSAIKSLTEECHRLRGKRDKAWDDLTESKKEIERLRAQRDEAFADVDRALEAATNECDLQQKLQAEQLEGAIKLEKATARIKRLQTKVDRQSSDSMADEDDLRSVYVAINERLTLMSGRYDR